LSQTYFSLANKHEWETLTKAHQSNFLVIIHRKREREREGEGNESHRITAPKKREENEVPFRCDQIKVILDGWQWSCMHVWVSTYHWSPTMNKVHFWQRSLLTAELEYADAIQYEHSSFSIYSQYVHRVSIQWNRHELLSVIHDRYELKNRRRIRKKMKRIETSVDKWLIITYLYYWIIYNCMSMRMRVDVQLFRSLLLKKENVIGILSLSLSVSLAFTGNGTMWTNYGMRICVCVSCLVHSFLFLSWEK
jgi:hypothetical protein